MKSPLGDLVQGVKPGCSSWAIQLYMAAWLSNLRGDVVGGIVSAAVATPLAMGYGMFAFVALGESYFASGALAGLYTALVVAILCVLLGDKSTTVYAPRITSTFFLGLLIYGLVHSDIPAIKSGGTSLILAITFSIFSWVGSLKLCSVWSDWVR